MNVNLKAPLVLTCALIVLTAASALAQDAPGFRLLAYKCVAIDPKLQPVVQFERGTFLPATGTALSASNSSQLLYVERGTLTLFSDQLGKTGAEAGQVYSLEPNSSLGVRNDDSEEASLLSLRLTEPVGQPQAAGFASPALLRALRARAAQTLQPLFVEFDLPPAMDAGDAYLVLAGIAIAPNATATGLTTSGKVAVVVEAGHVQLLEGPVLWDVFAGEWFAVDGALLSSFANPEAEPAAAFVVGIVSVEDRGLIGEEIRNDAASERHCPQDQG